jgi:hypothetical protein
MPKERVTMRKVREILRLVWSCGQSRTATAKSCGVSKTAVTDTVRRALMAKLPPSKASSIHPATVPLRSPVSGQTGTSCTTS